MKVVIEGIGGILSFNFLAPIIASYKQKFAENPDIKFYGTDFNSKLTEVGKDAITKLTDIGMIYLNKDSAADVEVYQSLEADIVYIVTTPHTHIPLLYGWLQRSTPPQTIIVEKPFSENIAEMTDLVEYLNTQTTIKTKVLALDAADEFSLHGERLKQIKKHLGTVTQLDFFWVHDLSGSDTNYKTLVPTSDYPNTRMHRFNFLDDQKRQVFDAFIHFLNPLEQLVNLDSAEVIQIKAAQYEGAEINGETFVAAKLLLDAKQETDPQIEARVYAGCGIGKIASLNLPAAHMIILSNNTGEQVRISIDEAKVSFINNLGKIVIQYPMAKMYHAEMYNLFFGDPNMGHSVDHTFKCLKILDQIRSTINWHIENSNLPEYNLGTTKNPAPSLEDVLSCMEPLANKSDQLVNITDQLASEYLIALNKQSSATIETVEEAIYDNNNDPRMLGSNKKIRANTSKIKKKPIIFNTAPKSGTVFLSETLYWGLDYSFKYISPAYALRDNITPQWIQNLFKEGSALTRGHFDASIFNTQLLKLYTDRIVVNFRDPRAIILSWTHHTNKHYANGNADFIYYVAPVPPVNIGYFEWDLKKQLDWQIENFLPDLVAWMQEWVAFAHKEQADNGFKVLITTYEAFKADEHGFFNKIIDFYEIPRADFKYEPHAKTEESHFRKGLIDEWKEAFTEIQLQRMSEIIPPKLLEMFGWELYAGKPMLSAYVDINKPFVKTNAVRSELGFSALSLKQ